MEVLKSIFTKSFLFDIRPSAEFPYLIPGTVIFFLLILTAAAIYIFVSKENKKFLGSFANLFITFGFLGLIHILARYESLPWIASRFTLLLILLLGLVWFTVILVWVLKNLPKSRKTKEVESHFEKYLPKAKVQKRK